MRKNLLDTSRGNIRIFSVIIIGVILVITTIFSTALYMNSDEKKYSDSIEEIIFGNKTIKKEEKLNIKPLKSSGVIWTTRYDCGDIQQNVNQYCIGETVFINGDKFEPNIQLYWNITGSPNSGDPHIIVDSG